VSLSAYALITVQDFKSYASIENSEIEMDALSIYGSDGTAATVAKSGNTLALVKAGGANPGTTTINLAAAAYDTLTELVTYINTLPGWVANLIGWEAAASTDIKNVAVTNCLGTANETTIKFYNNYSIERIIDGVSASIEKLLKRNIKSRIYKERYDGSDSDEIFLKNFPVTVLDRVSVGELGVIRVMYELDTAYNAYAKVSSTGVAFVVDGVSTSLLYATYPTIATLAAAIDAIANWQAEVTDAHYNNWPSNLLLDNPNIGCNNSYGYLEVPDDPIEIIDADLECGILKVPSAAIEGFLNIHVVYTAGYSVVPDDIISACCKIVKIEYDAKDEDLSMKSESMADYSYTREDFTKMLSPETMKALLGWRRRILA
jgi:hypothetical protein